MVAILTPLMSVEVAEATGVSEGEPADEEGETDKVDAETDASPATEVG